MAKLPRQIEDDPRRESVERALATDVRPIWSAGTLGVAHLPFTPQLEQALVWAARGHQVERGLETIDSVLDSEAKGLAAARDKHGSAAANRVSRLVVTANDGSERFYRHLESTLKRHEDRVLGVQVDVPCARMSEKIFGADARVKVLLVSDRDAVARVLLALAEP